MEKAAQVPGRRCHVKNQLTPSPEWAKQPVEIRRGRTTKNVQGTNTLLVRVMIGENYKLTTSAPNASKCSLWFRIIDPGWRCRSWCADALAALARDGQALGTSVLDWWRIEEIARRYVREKTTQGRFNNSALLLRPKPTWDLLENKEVVA